MSCLLTARVSGDSREPDPPASTIPFMKLQIADCRRQIEGSSSTLAETQTLAIVPSALNFFAPIAVIEIPARGVAQAVRERAFWLPAQLPGDLRRVDCVASIVAGS